MILPEFFLPSRANQLWYFSGMDSPDRCLDSVHFNSYPHTVQYKYNSRGFRDAEWPEDMSSLVNAIWCLGDSFTVGIGSPVSHTWPWLLQQTTQTRTINVSMDGASNNWLARKAQQIIQTVCPKIMILHWSFITRRERDIESGLDFGWNIFYNNIRDPSWPDCDRNAIDTLPKFILDEIQNLHGGWPPAFCYDENRLLQSINCTDDEDIENTLCCIDLVDACASDKTKIIHSFVPDFVPKRLKGVIESHLSGNIIPEFPRLDLARDGHHYDLLTSNYFVNQLMPLMDS